MSWVRNPLAAPIFPPRASFRPRSPDLYVPPAPTPKSNLFPEPAPLAPPRLFAGTSGWAYPTWKPGFYPDKLSARKSLGYYATRLNSVEVNHTFRTLPSAAAMQDWLTQTGPGFRFSFKAPQRITHFSRLVDCEAHLTAFLAAIQPAAESGRLGLILFQLPPNFQADPSRLRTFLSLPILNAPSAPPLSFEFRHPSWFTDEIYEILRAHNAALCIAETDELDTPEVHTASTFTSFRLRRHGGYTPAELKRFATKFRKLSQQRDVYAYFRHEDEPTGALNATAFLALASAVRGGRAA